MAASSVLVTEKVLHMDALHEFVCVNGKTVM